MSKRESLGSYQTGEKQRRAERWGQNGLVASLGQRVHPRGSTEWQQQIPTGAGNTGQTAPDFLHKFPHALFFDTNRSLRFLITHRSPKEQEVSISKHFKETSVFFFFFFMCQAVKYSDRYVHTVIGCLKRLSKNLTNEGVVWDWTPTHPPLS